MNPVGIMQGRLSEPLPGNAQYFPADRWEQEFQLACELGFDSIEWLFDETSLETNPTLSKNGRDRINQVAGVSGVRVSSICADYFKIASLAINDSSMRHERAELLARLIQGATELEAGCVLIPFIEGSSMRSTSARQLAREALEEPLEKAARQGVVLAVETDLPANELAAWLAGNPHSNLGVYYDVGNAVAMGYDPICEILVLAEWLQGVHIKDRTLDGPNVPLGTGTVDFTGCLQQLAAVGYEGSLVLETVRGADFVEDARRNLGYLRVGMSSLS